MSGLLRLVQLFQWLLLSLCLQPAFANEAPVDAGEVLIDSELQEFHELYQAFLNDHVKLGKKNGLSANMVDYAAVKKDERLRQLLALLNAYPKERLDSTSKTIAFYLNAYNILAIDKVAKHWPLFKLKSLGSYFKPVWAHPAGEVCGEPVTLRSLEHEILRKQGEPRIHFALNCASMSCPDLRLEPYVAGKLEEQLQDQTRIFFGQKKGVVVNAEKLKLSKIFDWFEEDFEEGGGVLAFVTDYLPKVEKSWQIEGYLDYDWAVNDELSGAELMRIKRGGSNTWFN